MHHPQLAPSPVHAGNVEVVEALDESYLGQPASVPEDWRALFEQLKGADSPGRAAVAKQIHHLLSGASRSTARPAAAPPMVRPRSPSRSRSCA
jgi:2-oxoglutarate dehydrogenase complex dehydrogenase (E1) component-like enzyme